MAYNDLPALGSATSANSLPVVIASDQGAIPVSSATLATAAKQDTIIGHVDGIEAALTAANASLDAIEASTAAGSTAANQTTIIGHLDGVEGLLTTIDSDTGGILTSVQLLDDTVATIGTTPLIKVAIFDAANAQITSFGGGTQYTEDAAAAADPVGNANILVRLDTPATITSTDGDNIAQRGTNYGAAYVQLVTSAGAYIDSVGGGTQYAVDAALGATPTGTLAIAIRDDALSALTPVEGDAIGLRVDANGALWVIPSGTTVVSATDLDIRNLTNVDVVTAELSATDNAVLDAIAASVAAIDTDSTTIIGHLDGVEGLLTTIDGDTGSIMTAVQLLDDTVVVLGTDVYTEATSKGLGIGAVRRDADTTLTSLTNEWGPLQMDARGFLKVEVFSGETLPVSGTVDLGATDNAVLDAIAASVAAIDTDSTTIIGHLDGVEGLLTTIDADTGSILLAVDGLETSNSAIQTAVELIDNAIGVEDAAETLGGGLMMAGSVRRDTAASSAGTTGDNATLNTDSLGRLWISGAAVEDAAETAGGILLMIGAVRRDTAASSSGTTGDNSTLNVDALGKLWTTGSYVEDTAHTAADVLTAVATRRIDTPASSAGTSGDYATLDQSAEGALWATLTPTTTGGCTIFRSLDLDETEEEIKATAGNVYGYYFYNASTSVRYLKFYNATAANTTVGTTTPVLTFPLPASTAGHLTFPYPVAFATAISAAVTTALADADTGAPAANDVILNVFYK